MPAEIQKAIVLLRKDIFKMWIWHSGEVETMIKKRLAKYLVEYQNHPKPDQRACHKCLKSPAPYHETRYLCENCLQRF